MVRADARFIKRIAKDYWVSLTTLAVVVVGLVVLIASQQTDHNWRATLARSQQRFARQLRVIEAEAAVVNARERSQPGSTPTPKPPASAATPRRSSTPSTTPKPPPGFPGPLSSGSYVDCTKVGQIASTDGVAGELDTAGNPQLDTKYPMVELTNVTAAVAGDTLCVDFTAKRPPTLSTFYEFQLGSPQEMSSTGPGLIIQVVFGPRGERAVALRYPGSDDTPSDGIVAAHVGIAGDSTSLLIDRRLFPSYVPGPPWAWIAEGLVWTGLESAQQVTYTLVARQILR